LFRAMLNCPRVSMACKAKLCEGTKADDSVPKLPKPLKVGIALALAVTVLVLGGGACRPL